jgi:hypothetical protein
MYCSALTGCLYCLSVIVCVFAPEPVFVVYINGEYAVELRVSETGGLQDWNLVSSVVSLLAGHNRIAVLFQWHSQNPLEALPVLDFMSVVPTVCTFSPPPAAEASSSPSPPSSSRWAIWLDSVPYEDVVVDVSVSDPSQLFVVPQRLVFPGSSRFGADVAVARSESLRRQHVVVYAQDDRVVESDMQFRVSLQVASLDVKFDRINGGRDENSTLFARVSVRDNDRNAVLMAYASDLAKGQDVVSEEDALLVLQASPYRPLSADRLRSASYVSSYKNNASETSSSSSSSSSGSGQNDTTTMRSVVSVLEGETVHFSVVLRSQPTSGCDTACRSGAVNMTLVPFFHPDDHSEIVIQPRELSFTSLNWNLPQVVKVTTVDDHIAQGNRSITILSTIDAADDVHYQHCNSDVSVQKLLDWYLSLSNSNT